MQRRLEELERRVGLNSGNSGKPPSSDGPAKPPAPKRTRSQRGRSGKRPRGQAGHQGATLRQTDSPDRIETHWPPSCGECAALALLRLHPRLRRLRPLGAKDWNDLLRLLAPR